MAHANSVTVLAPAHQLVSLMHVALRLQYPFCDKSVPG